LQASNSLGTLGGSNSVAYGVNDSGQIVGGSDLSGGGTDAFVYDTVHGMQDLNNLIPSNSGWTLQEAQGISSAGHIVGFGYQGDNQALFLLTPVAEITPTITFSTPPSPTYLGGDFTVTATTNSDGALTYSYLSGPCGLVSATAGTFSSTGAGTCVVEASTAAMTNFSANSATQNVTIAKARAIITFSAAPTPLYPGPNFTVNASASSGITPSYSYISGPCTLVSLGAFAPTGVGTCVVEASTLATTNFLGGSGTQNVNVGSAVSNLLSLVHNITGLGTSLGDQVEQVATDIASQDGAACQDLNAFENHVEAKSGGGIAPELVSQILGAVTNMKIGLKCGG
jgi:probable HAF family extracellular repeat protein